MKSLRFSRSQLCIPYAVFLALFVIAPLVVIVYYAFTNGEGNFSFANLAGFFSSTNTIGTLFYSFALSIVTTLVCLAIASSSFVGTHRSATLLPSFEITLSSPLTLFFSMSISVPR